MLHKIKIITNLSEIEDIWKSLEPKDNPYMSYDIRKTISDIYDYPIYIIYNEQANTLLPLWYNTDSKTSEFLGGLAFENNEILGNLYDFDILESCPENTVLQDFSDKYQSNDVLLSGELKPNFFSIHKIKLDSEICSTRLKKNIRYYSKNVTCEPGDIDDLPKLINFLNNRLENSVYKDSRKVQALTELMGYFNSLGMLYPIRLVQGGKVFAYQFNIGYKNTMYPDLFGWDSSFAKLSPGILCMWNSIQLAKLLGFELYSFGRGDADYKRKHWVIETSYTPFWVSDNETKEKFLNL